MTVTIMVVDDSKLARIGAGKTIAALRPDWVRVEASNAQEALQLVGEQQIDVAVLDFNMPGEDGLELAAHLRKSHPTMPIAIITANIQDEVISRARAVKESASMESVSRCRTWASGGSGARLSSAPCISVSSK